MHVSQWTIPLLLRVYKSEVDHLEEQFTFFLFSELIGSSIDHDSGGNNQATKRNQGEYS